MRRTPTTLGNSPHCSEPTIRAPSRLIPTVGSGGASRCSPTTEFGGSDIDTTVQELSKPHTDDLREIACQSPPRADLMAFRLNQRAVFSAAS